MECLRIYHDLPRDARWWSFLYATDQYLAETACKGMSLRLDACVGQLWSPAASARSAACSCANDQAERPAVQEDQPRHAFKNIAIQLGHAAVGALVSWLERHVNFAVSAEEQRHLCQRRTDDQMFEVNLDRRPGDVASHCQRRTGRQDVWLTVRVQGLGDGAVNAGGVVQARRKNPCPSVRAFPRKKTKPPLQSVQYSNHAAELYRGDGRKARNHRALSESDGAYQPVRGT